MGEFDWATQGVVLALFRASNDPQRPTIGEKGIDERDLAFEANLLQPSEVETKVYGTQKRSSVLRLFRWMHGAGLINMTMTSTGSYHIFPTDEGNRYAQHLKRPWLTRLFDKLYRRKFPED